MSRPRPSRIDAVVVGDEDADHRSGTSSSTVVPWPGAERIDSVPSAWRTRLVEQREADVALLAAARALAGVEKPLPSSVTTSRVSPGSGRVTSMRTVSASACFWALRSASRATR